MSTIVTFKRPNLTFSRVVGKKKIDKDMADNLYNHIKGRLADLLSKVMQERNKLKYKEYLEYLKRNPPKSKSRRMGFIQNNLLLTQRNGSVNDRRLSGQSRIMNYTHQKRGSAVFIHK